MLGVSSSTTVSLLVEDVSVASWTDDEAVNEPSEAELELPDQVSELSDIDASSEVSSWLRDFPATSDEHDNPKGEAGLDRGGEGGREDAFHVTLWNDSCESVGDWDLEVLRGDSFRPSSLTLEGGDACKVSCGGAVTERSAGYAVPSLSDLGRV